MNILEGNIVDVVNRRIFKGKIVFDNTIKEVIPCLSDSELFIMPGFVDSHIHIESSMLSPQRFAEAALKFGVLSVIADPHEISNVCGIKGFDFMLNDASLSPLKFYFAVPSCVPSVNFDKSGAEFGPDVVKSLLSRGNVVSLGEMMNFVGVTVNDPDVIAKINYSLQVGKPVDGHAPGLDFETSEKYFSAGISTDHECGTIEEAEFKAKSGVFVQIRKGSAADNQAELLPLFRSYPKQIMLCSDDLHPDDMQKGYMAKRISDIISQGYDLFDVLTASSYNPVKHYKLDMGLLQPGDKADFIVVDNLRQFNVKDVYLNGDKFVSDGNNLFSVSSSSTINYFNSRKISLKDISLSASSDKIKVIKANDGSLLTDSFVTKAVISDNCVISDPENDVLKIVVLSRYYKTIKPAVGFISGFNLKHGAVGASICHDSHNIICVGVDDQSIVNTINKIVENRGGLAISVGNITFDIPLEIAGLMSVVSCETVSEKYLKLCAIAKSLGCKFNSPFMTLSFMALPVIPNLKIVAGGLFDVSAFKFTDVFA